MGEKISTGKDGKHRSNISNSDAPPTGTDKPSCFLLNFILFPTVIPLLPPVSIGYIIHLVLHICNYNIHKNKIIIDICENSLDDKNKHGIILVIA